MCGGPDSEHEISLQTGQAVYEHIDQSLFDPEICVINKDRSWSWKTPELDKPFVEWSSISLIPFSLTTGSNDLKNRYEVDIVFNALHGQYGEGGYLQAILDQIGIKYTGSGMQASVVGIDKELTQQFVLSLNLKRVQIPKTLVLEGESLTQKDSLALTDFLHQKITSKQVVIKSATGGSSLDVFILPNNNWSKPIDSGIYKAIKTILATGEKVIIQEFISGLEVTCPVLGDRRYHDQLALPVGLIKPVGAWFDHHAKYSGESEEIFPAPLDTKTAILIREKSRRIHTALGCRGLSRSDFIVTSEGKIYFLEINTSPGLTPNSLCPKAAAAHGWSYTELITKIIQAVG